MASNVTMKMLTIQFSQYRYKISNQHLYHLCGKLANVLLKYKTYTIK